MAFESRRPFVMPSGMGDQPNRMRHQAGVILQRELFADAGGNFSGVLGPQTLHPDSTGGGSWGLVGAGTKHEAVATDDGDTSYIESGAGVDLDQLFTLPDAVNVASIPDAGWILRVVGRSVGGGLVNGPSCRLLNGPDMTLIISDHGPAGASVTTSYQEFLLAQTAGEGAGIKARMIAGTLWLGFRIGAGNANVFRITETALLAPASPIVTLGAGESFESQVFNVCGYTFFMLAVQIAGTAPSLDFAVRLLNPNDGTEEALQAVQTVTASGNIYWGSSPLPSTHIAMSHYVQYIFTNSGANDLDINYGVVYCNTG
jgi:hypothetical protein